MEELLLHVCHTLTQRLDSHPGSQSWKDLVSAANQHGSSALSDSDVFLSRAYGLQLRGRFPRLAAFYFLLTVSVLAWNPTLLLWLGIWTGASNLPLFHVLKPRKAGLFSVLSLFLMWTRIQNIKGIWKTFLTHETKNFQYESWLQDPDIAGRNPPWDCSSIQEDSSCSCQTAGSFWFSSATEQTVVYTNLWPRLCL